MNPGLEKLRRISSGIRIFIWILTIAGLVQTFIGFLTSEEFRQVVDPNLALLWQNADVSKVLLVFISLPYLIMFMVFAYSLQKILQLFSKGSFFNEAMLRYFKWMIWANLIGTVYPILQSLCYGYFQNFISGDATIYIKINGFNMYTALVLFIVFYLINAALQIDRENKEFI